MPPSTPKRHSGLPMHVAGALSSTRRKSKLPTPQRRRVSRLPSFQKSDAPPCPHEGDGGGLGALGDVPVAVPASPKRPLDGPSYFSPGKKKSASRSGSGSGIVHPTHPKSNSARRQSSHGTMSPPPHKPGSQRDDNEEAVRVGVRIRPLDAEDERRSFVLGPAENTVQKNAHADETSLCYAFDRVYGETSTTRQLYDELVADIVRSVVRQGRNGTCFTYGQTNTGKTYTMHGILLAAGRDVFRLTEDDDVDRDGGGDSGSFPAATVSVRVSCMELYNEELRDLLVDSSASLSIQEDGRGSVRIPNLSERIVDDVRALMEIVAIAEEHRTVGSTAMNERSSRSHTIFRVTYERREERDGGEDNDPAGGRSGRKVTTTTSTLFLVDLAGSESVRVTGATGGRQKEGGKINQSLLTLSRVLEKLGKKGRGHVNFRDSKLTRILKSSLSGDARMACVCCISPAPSYAEETRSTLDFAARTMLVTTNARSNQRVVHDDPLVGEFEMEIERAKLETARAEEDRRKMERSLKDANDQIARLRAGLEIERRKTAKLEEQNNSRAARAEEVRIGHQERVERLSSELRDAEARNRELEAGTARAEADNDALREQLEVDRESFRRDLARAEEERSSTAEHHRAELRNKTIEIDLNKRVKEELKAANEELTAELDRVRGEQRASSASNEERNDTLLGRVAELEFQNEVLSGELATARADRLSREEETAALRSEVEALTERNLRTEWKLAREMQKARKRKDEAKERRQRFKGKLAGMTEVLKDDLVQLSYEKDY